MTNKQFMRMGLTCAHHVEVRLHWECMHWHDILHAFRHTMHNSVHKVILFRGQVVRGCLWCCAAFSTLPTSKQRKHSRLSPFLTSNLRPIPIALLSLSTPGSAPHGALSSLSQTGSIAPLPACNHRRCVSQAASSSAPHAAHTSHSCETSRIRTRLRNTYFFSAGTNCGASDARASYSTRKPSAPSAPRCAYAKASCSTLPFSAD